MRKSRRWTQAKLALKAGVDRASVYRLEAGRRSARPDTLFRIAGALDVSICELVPDWPEWDPMRGRGHGEVTRERRRALGLSLARLATEIGVSEATLSRHERSIGVSPALVGRMGEDFVAANDRLATALGFADVPAFERYVVGLD